METTNHLLFNRTYSRNIGNNTTEKTVIRVLLGDECRNGHEDFSVTAQIYRDGRGYGGGCCHDHILELQPSLKLFVDLHLSDFRGAPMHAVENAFYWYAGWKRLAHVDCHGGSGGDGKSSDDCREIFRSHLRCTDEEMQLFDTCGATHVTELQAHIEDLKMPERWRREADVAIATLESLTGKKFETKSTRTQFNRLTDEQRSLHLERYASGWYKPEAVAKRIAEKVEAKKQKLLKELEEDRVKAHEKIETKYMVRRWMIDAFGSEHRINLIHYEHENSISSNWSSTNKLLTKEEFDEIAAKADMSKLPAGLTFKWNENPRY